MKYIKDICAFLTGIPDKEISQRAFEENIKVLRIITYAFLLAEVTAIGIFAVHGNGHYLRDISILYSGMGFLINMLYLVCDRIAERQKNNSVKRTIIQTVYLIAIISLGVKISIFHYTKGIQAIILYLVMFSIVCFITLPPRCSTPVVVIPFVVFYYLMYRYDKAIGMITVNYICLAMTCLLSTYMRYSFKVNAFSRMVDLEKINLVLGMESRRDKMTGLRNRLALSDDYNSYKDRNLFIMMVDIDYFKQYNDTYGHLKGDEVLKSIANALIETFSSKYSYRFGGDELMVIIPDHDTAQIREMVASWLSMVESIRIEGVDHQITCSYGCAYGKMTKNEDLIEMQRQADERLYESKKHRPEWKK